MSDTKTTNYSAPKTIDEFMGSSAPVRLIVGPIGSGKSSGCAVEIVRRCAMQAPGPDGVRRSRWVIVRNTKQQLRDTTLKTWLQWFPDGVWGKWREVDQSFLLQFNDIRAEILFRALDTPDDQNRLLSLELTGGWVNEAREIPGEIITALRSRLGRYPSANEGGITWQGLICDTNPFDVDSWWHDTFVKNKPETWAIFNQPGGLDPAAENLEWLQQTPDTLKLAVSERRVVGRKYYEDQVQGAAPDWVDVHVNAKYGRSRSGKPVYERTFVKDFHVSLIPLVHEQLTPIVIGVDFGRTPAAVFTQRNARGRLLCLAELTSENMGLETFIIQKVKPMLASRFLGTRVVFVGDPTGWNKAQTRDENVEDIFRAAGFVSMRAPTNAIDRRIPAVEKELGKQIDGKSALVFDPSCAVLLAGFEYGYAYPQKRGGGQAEGGPAKTHPWSDVHDALQYAVLGVNNTNAALLWERPAPYTGPAINLAGWT